MSQRINTWRWRYAVSVGGMLLSVAFDGHEPGIGGSLLAFLTANFFDWIVNSHVLSQRSTRERVPRGKRDR